jgi:hypothetical protein
MDKMHTSCHLFHPQLIIAAINNVLVRNLLGVCHNLFCDLKVVRYKISLIHLHLVTYLHITQVCQYLRFMLDLVGIVDDGWARECEEMGNDGIVSICQIVENLLESKYIIIYRSPRTPVSLCSSPLVGEILRKMDLPLKYYMMSYICNRLFILRFGIIWVRQRLRDIFKGLVAFLYRTFAKLPKGKLFGVILHRLQGLRDIILIENELHELLYLLMQLAIGHLGWIFVLR